MQWQNVKDKNSGWFSLNWYTTWSAQEEYNHHCGWLFAYGSLIQIAKKKHIQAKYVFHWYKENNGKNKNNNITAKKPQKVRTSFDHLTPWINVKRINIALCAKPLCSETHYFHWLEPCHCSISLHQAKRRAASVTYSWLYLSARGSCRQAASNFSRMLRPGSTLTSRWPWWSVTAHLFLAYSSSPPACSRANKRLFPLHPQPTSSCLPLSSCYSQSHENLSHRLHWKTPSASGNSQVCHPLPPHPIGPSVQSGTDHMTMSGLQDVWTTWEKLSFQVHPHLPWLRHLREALLGFQIARGAWDAALLHFFFTMQADILLAKTEKKILASMARRKMVWNWLIWEKSVSFSTKKPSEFVQIYWMRPFVHLLRKSFHRLQSSIVHLLYTL